jgi:hypothetical protein
MATEGVAYLTYIDAVLIHIELMRQLSETRYGVFDRSLAEAALARPEQAASYSQANIHTQAARAGTRLLPPYTKLSNLFSR